MTEWNDTILSAILLEAAELERDAIRRYLDGATAEARAPIIDSIVRLMNERAGRFRCLRTLDRGGSGSVLHVADDASGQELALKIHIHSARNHAERARFERAVRQVAARPAEGFEPILLLGVDGPFLWVAREYVPGEALPRCDRITELSFIEKLLALRKIAAALVTARENGIPCELKLTRIVIDSNGDPRLLDYGFVHAYLNEATAPACLNEIGEELTTEAAHVYALGRILGRFFAPSDTGTPKPDTLPSNVPEVLRNLYERALANTPEDRIPTDGFIDSLDELLVGHLAQTADDSWDSDTDSETILTRHDIDRIARTIVEAGRGRYRDVRCVDKGGMGAIFVGEDTDLSVLRTFKVPLRRGFTEETRQEVLRLARLRHKNIVTVHEFTATGELCFFVMDYLPGVDLARLYSGATGAHHFTYRETAALVRDLALAVDYLHGQRPPAIHNDIKPRNVYIVDLEASTGAVQATPSKPARWEPVLLDFGLCRCIDERPPEFGTVGWVAPERLARGELGLVGPASDVWNLGALLAFLLTNGESVRTGSPDPDGLPPLPPPDLFRRHRVPRRLAHIATQCLRENPVQRPSARAVADALQRYIDGRRIWRGVALLLLAALALGTIGLAAYLLVRPPEISDNPVRWLDSAGKVHLVLEGARFGGDDTTVMLGGHRLDPAAFDATEKRISVVLDPAALPQDVRHGRQPVQIAVPRHLRSRTVHVHIPAYLKASALHHIGSNPKDLTMGRNVFGHDQWGVAVAATDRSTVPFFGWIEGHGLNFRHAITPAGPPHAVAFLDIEKDGDDDIVVVTDRDLLLWINDGAGRFTNGPDHAVEHCVEPEQRGEILLTVGDFTEDGYPDVAFADARGLKICRNAPSDQAGRRRFMSPSAREPLRGIHGLTAADLTGTGRGHDLVAIIQTTRDVELRALTRADGFTGDTYPPMAINGTTYALVAADFDGDGDDDVAVAFEEEIHLCQWAGGFIAHPRSARPVPPPVAGLEAGDFDNDGRPELIAINHHEAFCRYVSLHANLGEAGKGFTFSGPALYPCATAGIPRAIAVGCIDGDMIPDVCILAPGDLIVRLGLEGGLTDLHSLTIGEGDYTNAFAGPDDLAVADLNGDASSI